MADTLCIVKCNQTRSCDSLNVISDRDVNVTCEVDQACEGGNITVSSQSSTSNITVNIRSLGAVDAPLSESDGETNPRVSCVGDGVSRCNLLCGDTLVNGNKACENVQFSCDTPNYCNIQCGHAAACRFDNLVCTIECIYFFIFFIFYVYMTIALYSNFVVLRSNTSYARGCNTFYTQYVFCSDMNGNLSKMLLLTIDTR